MYLTLQTKGACFTLFRGSVENLCYILWPRQGIGNAALGINFRGLSSYVLRPLFSCPQSSEDGS